MKQSLKVLLIILSVFLFFAPVSCKSNNNGDIFELIRENNKSGIVRLLKKEPDAVKQLNGFEENPLFYAIRYGKEDIALMLIGQGSDINHQDEMKRTCLMFSLEMKNVNISKHLINKGADVNCAMLGGNTPFIAAAGLNDIEMLTLLLSKGANLNHINDYNQNALYRAAFTDSLESVKFLINKGLLIDGKKDIIGPIYAAVSGNALNVLNYLLEKYAGINGIFQTQITPIMLADTKETVLVLMEHNAAVYLKTKNDMFTALHFACMREGSDEVAEILIRFGAEINALDTERRTPLMFAALNNKKEIVELLLEYKAGVYIKDNDGRKALFYAVNGGSREIADMLLKQSADINSQDNKGYTCLFYAVINDDKDMVKYLIDKKINVKIKDITGKTAIDYAESGAVRNMLLAGGEVL